MDDGTRADIAYIAGRLISRRQASSVFDYTKAKYVIISGTVNDNNISIFDHNRSCHIAGNVSSLFDYGRGAHLSLTINGQNFSGFDYSGGGHFAGTVNGTSITIFDYANSKNYIYSI